MKSYLKSFIQFIIKNKQLNTFLICLFLSFALWVSITYSRNYEHSIVYPVEFVDKNNEAKIYTTMDSNITVTIKANGFEFLLNNGYKKYNKKIVLDINKLNINSNKGYAHIPSVILKNSIIKAIGYKGVEVGVSPDTINVSWEKVFMKKVPVVSLCKFSFKKPYQSYYPSEILTKEVYIEGSKSDLKKIDTIYTEKLTFKDIDRNVLLFVPIDVSKISKNVSVPIGNVPIRVRAERYTENVASIPINVIRYENYKNIKILPKEVKIRYRVALKDYKKVNIQDFNAYVLCSDEAIQKESKLKVFISNVPSFVKVVNIVPEKVEYVLFK
jgi:hypothetical protein